MIDSIDDPGKVMIANDEGSSFMLNIHWLFRDSYINRGVGRF